MKAVKAILLVACLLSAGCPIISVIDVRGTWEGTVEDFLGPGDAVTDGFVTVTISRQDGGIIHGTWSSVYADGTMDNAGSLEGSILDNKIHADLNPYSPQACTLHVTAYVNGGTMDFQYQTYIWECTGDQHGQGLLQRIPEKTTP